MELCANCNSEFKERSDKRGSFRFSVEKKLPNSDITARDALCSATGAPFTPASKRKGRFLCPSCWWTLNGMVKYKKSMDEFWGKSVPTSYVGAKRKAPDIPDMASAAKRPLFTSTPKEKEKEKAHTAGPRRSSTVRNPIVISVQNRHYGRAIKGLWNVSKGSKRQFLRFISTTIRQEMSALLKKETELPLCEDVNMTNIENFSWDNTLSVVDTHAPLLSSVLRGAVTTRLNEDSLQTKQGVNLKPIIGTALSCLVRGRSYKKGKFIPTLNSVQFWRGGLKRETIKQMSKTGICMSYETTLSAIDKLRQGFDKAALSCKSSLESDLIEHPNDTIDGNDVNLELSIAIAENEGNIEDELNAPASSDEEEEREAQPETSGTEESSSDEGESDSTARDSSDDSEDNDVDPDEDSVSEEESNQSSDDSQDESAVTESEERHPGFTLCWDNVGKKVTTRHPTADKSNTYLNMALGYLAVNRINTTHHDWMELETLPKAADLPNSTFVPSSSDFQSLRDRMRVVVGRIIARHMPWFRDHFHEHVTKHIVHDYTAQSSLRSVLVNLGVFNENPSSTQGAIGIYERLQTYVPSINGHPYPTLVYGDGLSCERGNDAHNARSNGLNKWERLEGLEPAVQEFHKEMILLQDYFDLFFSGASAADRGTLAHLKNIFNYRQVKTDVSDNFNHAWELMCLTTEGYVCLLAQENLKMNSVDSRPQHAPDDVETSTYDDRKRYFDSVCDGIVDKIWHHVDVNTLMTEDGTGPPVYCCGEDIDDPVVTCSAGLGCSSGQYFHSSCVDVDPAAIPDNWFCSDVCRNVHSMYNYCHCHQNLGIDEPMIGCSAEDQCLGSEWYHYRCVGIQEDDVPQGDWYCQESCRIAKKGRQPVGRGDVVSQSTDFVHNYSRAITWFGLNLLCRRDAVREADGNAMVSYWKLDHLHFFSANHHPKYLILSHRLIASISGWLPDKLTEDLIHNRTVNYGGGIGRNLPMDFMNEVLNRLFKDLLSAAKGRYTDTTIQRCSQIVGPLGEALDVLFDEKVVENEVYRHRRRSQNRDTNVAKFLTFLKGDRPFSRIDGRRHRAFPNFAYSPAPRNPGKFLPKMQQLSKRLDRRRRVVLQNQ